MIVIERMSIGTMLIILALYVFTHIMFYKEAEKRVGTEYEGIFVFLKKYWHFIYVILTIIMLYL